MEKPVYIGIIKIEEDEFIFKADNIKKIDPKKLEIGFNLGFDWDLEQEQFYVKLTVFYKYANPVEVELSKFVTTTGYEVKGLRDILNIKKEGFGIPDFFMLTFVGTAVSSARGMLAYKLSGTILSDFYLPLVDPNDFLEHLKEETKSESVQKVSPRKKAAIKSATKKKGVR